MERSSRNFLPSSSNRKFKAIFAFRTDILQETVVGCPRCFRTIQLQFTVYICDINTEICQFLILENQEHKCSTTAEGQTVYKTTESYIDLIIACFSNMTENRWGVTGTLPERMRSYTNRMMLKKRVVTKTWNDLKPPKTTSKNSTTIYNHLKPSITTSKTSTTTRKQS